MANNAYILFHYDESDSIYAITYNNGTSDSKYYLIKNLQGDVVQLWDSTNAVVAQYSYDAWGNIVTVLDANGAEITDTTHIAHINPIRYRGYYYDTETGFYYLQSRYYDPAIGRFISADALISVDPANNGLNLFAYCGNDPVNRIDESGKYWAELWEYTKAIAYEIGNSMASYASAYAGCGIIATSDGPLPILDVVAVIGVVVITGVAVGEGVNEAVRTASRSTTKEKVEEKTDPITPKINYNYWKAGIEFGNVVPYGPLSYSEARDWVAMGNNLLCRDHAAAYGIVKFYRSAIWDGRHGCEDSGYLNHYHLNSAHGNHVWYWGE